jgi:molecular chaperone DnaK
VNFDIDANGIVNVSAKDLGTGRTQEITITASSGLDEEEIKRMVRDAERNATEDRRKREVIDARNQADSLAYSLEKLLSENRDKLNPADVTAVESAIKEAKDAMETGDLERIRSSIDTLNAASRQMAQNLYGQSAQGSGEAGFQSAGTGGCAGGTCGTDPGRGGDDDFIDAEWREAAGG